VTVASVESRVFLPTVAVASNGVIGVTWYDFRNLIGKTRLTTDAWLAWSNDEGAAWRTLHLAGPFDLHTAHLSSDGLFLGDYEALAGLPDGFAAVYALAGPLSRSGPTDIFFSRIALPPGAP